MTPQQFAEAEKLMAERRFFVDVHNMAKSTINLQLHAQPLVGSISREQFLELYPRIKEMHEKLVSHLESMCEVYMAQIEAEIAKL
jgi:hypothetical protein